MRRVRARDAAVRRLQRLTAAMVAGAGALALVFAAVAAKAFPGRSTHHHVVRPAVQRAPAPRRPLQTAPPLTAAGSAAAPPAAAAPTPTPAPPVVVSGGS